MPLLDLDCLACGAEIKDLIVRNEDDKVCPACGAQQLQQRFSFPANYTISGNNSASVRPKRMGGSNND